MKPDAITCVIDGVTITVRELTLGEIRARFRADELNAKDPIGDERGFLENTLDNFINIDGVSVADIKRLTDATDEVLAPLCASQLSALVEKLRAANPVFFQLLQSVAGLQEIQRLGVAAYELQSSAPSVH